MTGSAFVLIVIVVAAALSLIMLGSWAMWRQTRNSAG
jgi:hypothetical protein